MTTDREAAVRLLERCGLEVTGGVAHGGPPVDAALHAVNGFEVEPVATVPASTPHAAGELDAAWHHHAAQASLRTEDGEFLVLPPMPGGSGVGWIRVKDRGGENLPSRVSDVTGSPEFMAASVEGRRLCAVSVEEVDYWVVVHEFPVRQEGRDMPDPIPAARSLGRAVDGADSRQVDEAAREFVEKLTFATAAEILAMLRDVLAEDWTALPPWARNLAYRLACLQRPDDPRLLREAAADLLCFGPDWDTFAEDLKRRAAELE
ncbi:hypothetical protein ACF09K_27510 [Streptomyces sp. NPDC014882]|uniref:hypothetical protein n=1 Tax=Streptomyces sp. NPDC014882 TaxID=3364927 RepID=UPI0036FBF778